MFKIKSYVQPVTLFPIASVSLTPINPRPSNPVIPIINTLFIAPQCLSGSNKEIQTQKTTTFYNKI